LTVGLRFPILCIGVYDAAALNATPMKKYTTCITMICMAVNFLIPRFSVGQETFNNLSTLLKNQSPLISFFTLSSIPIKLVSELLAKDISASAHGKSRPQKDDSRSANTSADYSLLSANAVSYVKNVFVKIPAHIATFAMQSAVNRCESPRCCAGVPGQGVLLLFTLMFFFLRPRSAIDDLIIFSYTRNKTRC